MTVPQKRHHTIEAVALWLGSFGGKVLGGSLGALDDQAQPAQASKLETTSTTP